MRQLANAIERAKILCDSSVIGVSDLPKELTGSSPGGSNSAPAPVATDDLAGLERAHIMDVLRRERGNKARAARALGVNRRRLYRLIEKYDIHVERRGIVQDGKSKNGD